MISCTSDKYRRAYGWQRDGGMAEYMLAAGVQPTHALATALVYAIRSETLDFAREHTGPDKAIHDLFFPRANHRLLARIQSPRLPFSYFANLHDALENLEAVDSLILSHLGPIDQPDMTKRMITTVRATNPIAFHKPIGSVAKPPPSWTTQVATVCALLRTIWAANMSCFPSSKKLGSEKRFEN